MEQPGPFLLGRGGSSTGRFIGEPGTFLRFQGGQHTFLNGSSIVAPDVEFTGGIAGEMGRAHAEKDEHRHAARTAARGGTGEVDGVKLFAEAFERYLGWEVYYHEGPQE